MRKLIYIAITVFTIIAFNNISERWHRKLNPSLTIDLPFTYRLKFYSIKHDAGIMFFGRSFDKRSIHIHNFDFKSQSTQFNTIHVDKSDQVCVVDGRLLISHPLESRVVSITNNQLRQQASALKCVNRSMRRTACGDLPSVFYNHLPDQNFTLKVCRTFKDLKLEFKLIDNLGSVTSMGTGGLSTTGMYVVNPGRDRGTYIAHNTSVLVTAESAVKVNTNTRTISQFEVPNLESIQQSRGLGAGLYGVELHEASGGIIVESKSRKLFFFSNQRTKRLATHAVLDTTTVFNDGCEVALIERRKRLSQLKIYKLCE